MGRGTLTKEDIKNREIISERIKELLKISKLRQIDLSNATSIKKQNIHSYIKGISIPNKENSQKIADFFQIPLEEFDPRYKVEKETVTKTSSERFKKLRKSKGYSIDEFSKLINISTISLNEIETGERLPRADEILKLAIFFEVSSEYIAGITENPTITNEKLAKILCVSKKLNSQNQEIILDFANVLLKKQI
ncbi:Helix-turn-helix [Pilibacter termitis]|uniref:Helix-turn-helix n=1 Tax=Pilibacter termitis TaxID=263852 RepID=A0A1T4KUK2_9ENTE|nr:helix-turn-helix transcriptional regulator [Pilibacter termitis]SJZ46101.1 Helix-turn-helix [Pilibacter termitis]